MDKPDEQSANEKRLLELETRVMLCEAAGRAQMVMTKALIATHPDLTLLADAFREFSEGAVSRALGTTTSDKSIAAFESFRDEWLRMLKQAR